MDAQIAMMTVMTSILLSTGLSSTVDQCIIALR